MTHAGGYEPFPGVDGTSLYFLRGGGPDDGFRPGKLMRMPLGEVDAIRDDFFGSPLPHVSCGRIQWQPCLPGGHLIQIVSNIQRSALTALCGIGLAGAAEESFDVDYNEKVTVRTDRITLAGRGNAVIQGGTVSQGVELDGLVTVDGARGVVIRNLTIQRSWDEGIFGTRGAAFTVESVTLQDNADAGLRAASSTIDITRLSVAGRWRGTRKTRHSRSSHRSSRS